MSKYEQLIEYIINEDEAKARELFHTIVVEKSREIYESMMDEAELDEMGGNQVERLADEVTSDEEGMQEAEDEYDSEEGEEDNGDLGGEIELGGDDMGDEMGGHDEGSVEDRVMDLEDALDELKAEFDALMGDEANEPEHHDGMSDPSFGDEEELGELSAGAPGQEVQLPEGKEEDDEEDDEEEDLDESRGARTRKMTEAEWIREYVEKIGEYPGEQANPSGKMAGTGNKSEKQGERNTKSIVAGSNNMGGTAKNIAQKTSEADPDGKQIEQPNNEYAKGRGQLKDAGKFANVPGKDEGHTAYKTKTARQPEQNDTETGKLAGADGKRPINKKSPIGGKIR